MVDRLPKGGIITLIFKGDIKGERLANYKGSKKIWYCCGRHSLNTICNSGACTTVINIKPLITMLY